MSGLILHHPMTQDQPRYCTCAANGIEIPSAHARDCRMSVPCCRCTCAMNADGSDELQYDADCAEHGEYPQVGYRCTPVSLAIAKAQAAKERAEVDAACRAYDLERDAAMLVLGDMIARFGAADVARWQRNICAGLGQ